MVKELFTEVVASLSLFQYRISSSQSQNPLKTRNLAGSRLLLRRSRTRFSRLLRGVRGCLQGRLGVAASGSDWLSVAALRGTRAVGFGREGWEGEEIRDQQSEIKDQR